jgi:tRNA dimethylallyltransferase
MMRASKKETILVLVGPTAIGKTRLSIKLARRIGGEIISCDSMQAYKGMNILTQAPTSAERKKAIHHLTGFFNPSKEFNANLFRKLAAAKIKSILNRKKTPIIVGGSGLYVKALIDGLFPSPEADVNFRNKMQRFISVHGSSRLHEKLKKIDPEAAHNIHPNDARRIIRALEIHHSTGRTMTELKSRTKGLNNKYNIKIFGLMMPREKIYASINVRADKMLGQHVIDEVEKLKRKNLGKTAKAVLGFREIAGYLDGNYDLTAAKDMIKMNTRRFAKRQMTWFKADKRIKWFDISRLSDDKIIKQIIANRG